MFSVVLKPRADKIFAKLPKELKQVFLNEFKKLAVDPFVLPVQKLRGADHGYRLRIGRWRILFTLLRNEKRIEIVDIFIKKGKEDYFRKSHLFK